MAFLQFYKQLSTKHYVMALLFLYITFFPSAVIVAYLGSLIPAWNETPDNIFWLYDIVQYIFPPYFIIFLCCLFLFKLVQLSKSIIFKRIWIIQLIIVIFLSIFPVKPTMFGENVYAPIALEYYAHVEFITGMVIVYSYVHSS